MPETIRQVARELLEQAGEAADLGRRHAQFFLARAEAADPFLPGHAEGWQERLAEDVGNLRAAADWFERSEEHTSELQSRFDLVCRLLLEKKKKKDKKSH